MLAKEQDGTSLRVTNSFIFIGKHGGGLSNEGMENDVLKPTETGLVLFDWHKEIYFPFPLSMSFFRKLIFFVSQYTQTW